MSTPGSPLGGPDRSEPQAGGHDLSGGGAVVERVSGLAAASVHLWPGGAEATVTLHTVSENATFLVAGPAGRSVLRIHRLGYHDRPAIDSELAWLEALRADTGIRTPAVIPALDGRRVVGLDDPAAGEVRWAVMFELLAGAEPARTDGDAFEHLGELTARLHGHARRWAPPAGFTRFSWDVDSTVGTAGRWGRWQDGPGVGPEERSLLERLVTVLAARLGAFGQGPERFGLIHADLRLANLLVDPAGGTSVIDFDDCGFGWRLYDLATAVSFFEHDPVVPGLIERWLAGYRHVLPLGEPEEAEIWTFVLLRRLLLLAWIGSHAAVEEARRLQAGFAAATCELAEQYLRSTPVLPARAPGR